MIEFTPEKSKQIALDRLDLISKWLEFRRKSNNKLQADYDFTNLHNTSNSYLYQILGKISCGTLHRRQAMLSGTEDYTKLLPGYVGSSIAEKPAYLKRNEKFHSNLHSDYVPTIEGTIKMIDMWLNFKNSQLCPNTTNMTIAEVLEARKRQNIDINILDDLMLATEVKTIQRNGIRF